MIKRKLQKLMGGVLSGVMAAAVVCGGMGFTASAEEVKEITMWEIQTEESMRSVFADSIARFEADHPGWKVNDVVYANEDYKQKIAIALGSDTAPDVFVTWTGGGMKEYIEAGRIADLTEYMNKDNYKDYFMDAAIAQATEDDKI